MNELLLEKIEQIAKDKYPDVDYWIDTGSRIDCAYAMLKTFESDLKVHRYWHKRMSSFFKSLVDLIKQLFK